MHITDDYSAETHREVEELFSSLGKPRRYPLSTEQQESDGRLEFIHPIFGLTTHYKGNDNYEGGGFTHNPYRGDHISIPAYKEGGGVCVIEISFHKGDTLLDIVDYPESNQIPRSEEAQKLIQKMVGLETR